MGAPWSLVCSNMSKPDWKAACWLPRPRPWKQSEAHCRTREELQPAEKLSSTATFGLPQEVLFGRLGSDPRQHRSAAEVTRQILTASRSMYADRRGRRAR